MFLSFPCTLVSAYSQLLQILEHLRSPFTTMFIYHMYVRLITYGILYTMSQGCPCLLSCLMLTSESCHWGHLHCRCSVWGAAVSGASPAVVSWCCWSYWSAFLLGSVHWHIGPGNPFSASLPLVWTGHDSQPSATGRQRKQIWFENAHIAEASTNSYDVLKWNDGTRTVKYSVDLHSK